MKIEQKVAEKKYEYLKANFPEERVAKCGCGFVNLFEGSKIEIGIKDADGNELTKEALMDFA